MKKSAQLTIFLQILAGLSWLAVAAAASYRLDVVQIQNTAMTSERVAIHAKLTATTQERDTLTTKLAALKPCPELPPLAMQSDVQAVLEPSPETTSDYQTRIDALKKRYEDILVSYFVLRKCEKNAPTDYHIIISALSQEMASVNAPGRLQYDVLTSAQGSYKELYSGNQCDDATLDILSSQYKIFVDSISEQFMPR